MVETADVGKKYHHRRQIFKTILEKLFCIGTQGCPNRKLNQGSLDNW